MNLNGLDLNLLRVLDALLAERSVTRAGERIGLSQPAVSAALGRLRHALNDQLFIRNGNEMVPTPRAESLREPIRSSLTVIEQAFWQTEPFEAARLNRTFSLLSADFFSTLFMPVFAAQMLAEAPGIRIKLIDSASGDVNRLLADGMIDAALERPLEIPEWISKRHLFTSPFVVVARTDHPALVGLCPERDRILPLDIFCTLHHAIRSVDGTMTGFADEALARIGRSRTVALALPHFHAVGLAVTQTDLIACLPSQFARAMARQFPLSIYEPPIDITVPEISLYWHARNDDLPAHIWLRDQIAAVCDSLGFAEHGAKQKAAPRDGLSKNSVL